MTKRKWWSHLFSIHCYTSPPDSHFPLLKTPSPAISDRNQQKSLHTWASSQAAHPYRALLPCLTFHRFSCCCPLSSQPVLTVLSLPCTVSTLLLEWSVTMMGFVSTIDFIGVSRILNTSLGAPSPCITVIQEHHSFLLQKKVVFHGHKEKLEHQVLVHSVRS